MERSFVPMSKRLEDYLKIVDDKIIANIFKKARRLQLNKKILNLNSTFIGGGVAEILDSVVPLMNNIGLNYGWRVLHGCPDFYNITKKFHNGLQGDDVCLSKKEKDLYLKINEEFSSYTHINHDFVIIHDPQPLPMAYYMKQDQPWICRIHVDLSNPNKKLWEFLKSFIFHYNVLIVSREEYKKKDLPIEQRVISPAIDPLSPKNVSISKNVINRYIKELDIPIDKPIITQVSRMDKWKDPEGVLNIYEKVKEKVDCRLLYCFNMASDDPEGMDIYNKVIEKAGDLVERRDIIMISKDDKLMVNAIQNISDVIVQKSTKEGFCLAVTEGLWKSKPVVASNVGGIPSQIIDGETGYLLDPYDYDGFADRIIELLRNKKLGKTMGKNAKEFVRQNFLTTRLIDDYLNLLLDLK
jgi:trehalose synthase